MSDTVRVEKAFAKVNLGLKILGKRTDGFHNICSLAQTVNLFDELRFRHADCLSVTCLGAELPSDENNLVLRSMNLFYGHLKSSRKKFAVELRKRIPIGAGLGGGSADAAATLRALNSLHGDPFDMNDLCTLGSQLGSDVPFLIEGGSAVLRGRGENITRIDWRTPIFYVLIYPEIFLSTSWAYKQVKIGLTEKGPYVNLLDSLSGGCVDFRELIEVMDNDFLPIIEDAFPIVATIRSQLVSAGALKSSISGSGSTVYGLFDNRNTALRGFSQLRARGYRSFFCQPLLQLT